MKILKMDLLTFSFSLTIIIKNNHCFKRFVAAKSMKLKSLSEFEFILQSFNNFKLISHHNRLCILTILK